MTTLTAWPGRPAWPGYRVFIVPNLLINKWGSFDYFPRNIFTILNNNTDFTAVPYLYVGSGSHFYRICRLNAAVK